MIGTIIEACTERVLYGRVENRDGNGALSNLGACAAVTDDICLGIGQGNIVARGDVCIIPADLEPDYAFLFSANPQLGDYGVIRKNWQAGRIKLHVSTRSPERAIRLPRARLDGRSSTTW